MGVDCHYPMARNGKIIAHVVIFIQSVIVAAHRLKTAGQLPKRVADNEPFGSPAEAQLLILDWGRSLMSSGLSDGTGPVLFLEVGS